MADRQLKLPFSAKPVTRVVPARSGAAAIRPRLVSGNKGTAGSVESGHPARVASDASGAPGRRKAK